MPDAATTITTDVDAGGSKRRVHIVLLGFPIDIFFRERLVGLVILVLSCHEPFRGIVMAMCCACDIFPKINCLDFMVISLGPQEQSCSQSLKNETAVKF